MPAVGVGPRAITPEVVVGDRGVLAAERRFDAILYTDVLEQIVDDHGEMARVARHLAAAGSLSCCLRPLPTLYNPFDRAGEHKRRYTARTLADMTPPTCVRERRRSADSVGLLASAVTRVLLGQSIPTVREILI